ncbi:MAG TPA: DUF4249 family protein, partial [Bacteroidetes bacterium]|nr:DUF4249 family protein [Bacteroidota bacterium]
GGIYASINTLQVPNDVYTLKVNDTVTGKSVTASTRMLSQVRFQSITPVIERSASDTSIYLDYVFNDFAGENWYAINIVKRDSGNNTGIDINSFFSAGLNVSTQTELLTDKAFPEITHSARLKLVNVQATDSIAVTISNVSEAYYDFLREQKRAEGLLSQITKEPINRSSNVIGGYGFFNAHFPDIQIFDLNDF